MAIYLETITYLAGAGVIFGIIGVALDFLDYHEQKLDERKFDYDEQRMGQPHKYNQFKKPNWINILKYSIPEVASNYKEVLKHPIKSI